MFLFRAHDFVSGGLAYGLGHGGSRDAVLGCGDSVRNALPRHLLSLDATKDLGNVGFVAGPFIFGYEP